jgi:aminoglycoside 3-N-acetyltransferase I
MRSAAVINRCETSKGAELVTYRYERLGPNDVQPMRDLLRVFADAFAEQDTYLSAPPRDSYLRKLLGQNHFIALTVGTEEGVVGGLTAYVLTKFEQERSEIYIYDLAVTTAYRRQGIASELIRRLKEVARSYQAWVVFVQADPIDEPAVKLYTSIGRREDVCHFDILL